MTSGIQSQLTGRIFLAIADRRGAGSPGADPLGAHEGQALFLRRPLRDPGEEDLVVARRGEAPGRQAQRRRVAPAQARRRQPCCRGGSAVRAPRDLGRRGWHAVGMDPDRRRNGARL